jgi:hypothetical protein
MVKTDIEGHQIDFILDTGAAISTMTTPTSKLTKDSITIIGATGNTRKYRFCELWEYMVGGHQVRHQFSYVPEAPGPFWKETYFLNSAPQYLGIWDCLT